MVQPPLACSRRSLIRVPLCASPKILNVPIDEAFKRPSVEGLKELLKILNPPNSRVAGSVYIELGAHGSRKSRGQAECDGRFHRLNLSVTAAATAAIIPNTATRARRGMWAQACCAAS